MGTDNAAGFEFFSIFDSHVYLPKVNFLAPIQCWVLMVVMTIAREETASSA